MAKKKKTPTKWVRTEADKAAVAAGCYFDPRPAVRVEQFFARFLRHSKGQWAGKPFELMPWQRDYVIYPLFGWRRPNGRRRFTSSYIEIPKKNGKSALASALAIYLLVADGEPGAEVYNAATDQAQSRIVFREAAHMVARSPSLSCLLKANRTTGTIHFDAAAAWMQSLSADVPSKEGLNASAIIFDELHAQKTRTLWDTLRYATAARRQPLRISITTAGYDRRTICWEQHEAAREILEGRSTDTECLPVIYAARESDDWADPAVWAKANPSLGTTISVDSFRADWAEAAANKQAENAFRRYRLNQWTEQENRWIRVSEWDACGQEIDAAELEGRECFGGLDLANTLDLASLCLVFPSDCGERFDAVWRFWCPEEASQRRERRQLESVRRWIDSGYITPTPGDEIDYARIRADIAALSARYRINSIAFDPWNATETAQRLAESGLSVVKFPQTMANFNEPCRRLEQLLSAKNIRHGGNPVARWMAGNVAVVVNGAGHMMPHRAKSKDKVDGVVALLMALAKATQTGRTSAGVYFGD